MSSVADRIQEKMSELGLKHKDLVSATGASKGAVSHWLSGVNTPSGERLLSLARLLKVTPDWILTGKESKQGISNKIEHESNVSFISAPLREIPLLDYVQAGLFHDVGYDGINPIGSSWTTYMGAKPECIFSLKVEGLSMSPTFMPGDELVVDGSLEARPGSLVIAQEVQHGIARTTFKKYRVIGVNEFGVDIIELVPLNPDFPTLNSLQIDISIIGVVVRHNREV